MNEGDFRCACLAATTDIELVRDPDGRIPLGDFQALREQCIALRLVLLPDTIWPQFLKWHEMPDDVASHSSILLLAFRRGYLPCITAPIHRYLLSSTGVLPNVSKQYLQDLREKWMFDEEPLVRHQQSRIYRGKLLELQFASWLESQGHTVVGLEATRKGPDIETIAGTGEAQAFEVKFFGMEDNDFGIMVKSMGGHPAGGAISAYQPINYLLFRVYEAARQLKNFAGRKTVVIIIDEIGWFRFDMQVRGNWINWANPQFIAPDETWNEFMSHQQKRYPDLLNDLAETVRGIDRIQVFRQNAAFEFRLEREYKRE